MKNQNQTNKPVALDLSSIESAIKSNSADALTHEPRPEVAATKVNGAAHDAWFKRMLDLTHAVADGNAKVLHRRGEQPRIVPVLDLIS